MEVGNKAIHDSQFCGNISVVGKTVWKNMFPTKTCS